MRISINTEVSSEVADLEATSFNETTLVITWRLPANPNGNIFGYFISIADITGDTIIIQENITSTSLTQTNLGSQNGTLMDFTLLNF